MDRASSEPGCPRALVTRVAEANVPTRLGVRGQDVDDVFEVIEPDTGPCAPQAGAFVVLAQAGSGDWIQRPWLRRDNRSGRCRSFSSWPALATEGVQMFPESRSANVPPRVSARPLVREWAND